MKVGNETLPQFFIISYHRPQQMKTLTWLRRINYPMKNVHVVIDDEGGDEEQYRKTCADYGCELHVFEMKEARRRFDFIHRKSKGRRAAGLARNAIYDIAFSLGIRRWVITDDDTSRYSVKYPAMKERACSEDEFKSVLMMVFDMMDRKHIGFFGLPQSGDFIGGVKCAKWFIWKVMNTTFVDARYVYKPERGVQDNDTSAFVGIMNEGYFTASLGYGVSLHQTASATQAGGLTDNYRENKLLNKSLICPIQFPSAIYANYQRKNGGRLHHTIEHKYLMPCVLKVAKEERSNLAWDAYPEDVVFRNDRRRDIVVDDERNIPN